MAHINTVYPSDDLSSVDLLAELQREGLALRDFRGNYTNNIPCPFCGGRDRFNVSKAAGGTQWAHCRKCDKHWNAITYIMRRDGVSREEARAFWKLKTKPARNEREQPKAPPIVAPPQAWQDKALAFVEECESVLWSEAGAKALDYLRGRGLTDETIKRNRLGFNVSRREWRGEEWGIERDVIRAHAGVTIPRFILGELWAVNVRRGAGADPKYMMLTGSILGLAGADALKGADVAIAFGGEFDRMLAEQHAPEGVACITFGGESVGVGETWRNMLQGVRSVLVAYDVDQAGDQGAFRAWFKAHKSVRRVKVPQGKDLTDYMQAGGNVAEWLAAQVAKTLPRSPQAEKQIQKPAIEQPARAVMAQDAAEEPIAPPSPAEVDPDAVLEAVVAGYIRHEGQCKPSELMGQVVLVTGWEKCEALESRLRMTLKAMAAGGRVALRGKALVWTGGEA